MPYFVPTYGRIGVEVIKATRRTMVTKRNHVLDYPGRKKISVRGDDAAWIESVHEASRAPRTEIIHQLVEYGGDYVIKMMMDRLKNFSASK